ncbi:hypothetical protein T439DRAFT_323067 [Meredithblackwellia eburnea MCA 4105]
MPQNTMKTSSGSPATVQKVKTHHLSSLNESSWRSLGDKFELGAFDQLVLSFIPVAVVFVYDGLSSSGDSGLEGSTLDVTRLCSAIQRLLDYYPHLTGRLQVDPSSGLAYIDQLGTGVEFVEATCDVKLLQKDLTMDDLPDRSNALFAPFSIPTHHQDPILTIQRTQFACGRVSLGVRCLHKCTDADAFFQLVRDLAELYRGLGGDDEVPSLRVTPTFHPYCTFSSISTSERQTADAYEPPLYFLDPGKAPSPESNATPPAPPPLVEGRFLRISKSELDKLKVTATNPNPSSTYDWVSTFEALSAYLYQEISRARLAWRDQDPAIRSLSPPDFLSPINMRSLLGLGPKYVGNVLLHSVVSNFTHASLLDNPLWQVAKALHDAIRIDGLQQKDQVVNTAKWIISQPDLGRIRNHFRYGNGAIMISQWSKMDMHQSLVFDAPAVGGKPPILVSTPFTNISLIDGLIYFLPPGDNSGDIEVCMALSSPVWPVLEEMGSLGVFENAST